MSTTTVTQTVVAPKTDNPLSYRNEDDRTPYNASSITVDNIDDVVPTTRKLGPRLIETIRSFWHLGFTAFGGPGVHVVILRRLFVDKLKWVDPTTFADLFALGNALPGPGSTQLAFSIAVVRNGTVAGLLAFLLWSLPGAVGMAALGAGVRAFPATLPPIVLALLTGLNASAVGLIALAAYQLSQTAITDGVTRLLVLGTASFGICYHAPWMYPVLVFSGGLITLVFDYRRKLLDTLVPVKLRRRLHKKRDETPPSPAQDIELEALPVSIPNATVTQVASEAGASSVQAAAQFANASGSSTLRNRVAQAATATPITPPPAADTRDATTLMVPNKKLAWGLGLTLIVFIVTLLVVRGQLPSPPRTLDFFANMVLAGVIIFGGGPVVIPLLRGYTVDYGWVESRDFLLGFAILQAFPGPNFNFAVYLGMLAIPSNPLLGAFLGWLGIFSPGILLKLALLPLYNSWRKLGSVKSILRGLNAAAAGLVYTAVWQLFLVGYIYTPATSSSVQRASTSGPLTVDPFWGVVAASAFVATQWFKSPPALTIVGGALAGMAWFGVVGVARTERG
jgi:chromate transport protein ChrA